MTRRKTVLVLALLCVTAIAGIGLMLIGLLGLPTSRIGATTVPPTATATPTATPTPPPTQTPTPTPVPQFGPMTFGTGVQDGRALNAGLTFPAGTTEVYACWSYQDVANNTPYRLRWYLDGTHWSEQLLAWDAGRYGSTGTGCLTHVGEYDADGLPAGNYRLELFIDERQVQMATMAILAPTPTPVLPTPTPRPDIRAVGQQAARSLVQIEVPTDRLFAQSKAGSGSIVDGERGLILTNWHLMSTWLGELLNEGGFAAIYLTVDLDHPPEFTYWAQVLPQCSDPDRDLAVLQITHRGIGQARVAAPLGLPAIPIGDSDLVHTSDPVLLLGFPNYAEGLPAWIEGVVTTHDRSWIKSDAGISHGHSGGMMLNERGELIGVIARYQSTTAGGVLALARPVNLAGPLIAAATGAGAAPQAPSLPSGASSAGEIMMVLGVENLNLRDGPSLSAWAVGEIPHGSVVEVLRDPVWDGERFWYYVQVQGSTQAGWASGVYLAPWEVATAPILFTSDRGQSKDIYHILPDRAGLVQLTNDPADEGDPSWSPHRDRIAFTSNRSGSGDIYIMDSAGGPWMQLTSGPADDLHPVWSPDGQRIAFVSDRDGDWEIFVINTDGSGLQQITYNGAWDSFPAWSPDSTRLVYTSHQTGNYDLYLVDLTTRAVQQLTTSPYSDAHPSWAPSGDEIAYTMVVPEEGGLLREIGALNVYDPTHPRRITTSDPKEARNGYPDWSPDGRWIVFTSERDGNEEIYLIPARGGWATNLTNAPLSNDCAPVWAR